MPTTFDRMSPISVCPVSDTTAEVTGPAAGLRIVKSTATYASLLATGYSNVLKVSNPRRRILLLGNVWCTFHHADTITTPVSEALPQVTTTS